MHTCTNVTLHAVLAVSVSTWLLGRVSKIWCADLCDGYNFDNHCVYHSSKYKEQRWGRTQQMWRLLLWVNPVILRSPVFQQTQLWRYVLCFGALNQLQNMIGSIYKLWSMWDSRAVGIREVGESASTCRRVIPCQINMPCLTDFFMS